MDLELQCDVEAEQAVIGCILEDNDKYLDVSHIIEASDFILPKHSIIYTAIKDLFEKQIPFDVITIGERLERKKLLSEVGGYSYLSDCKDYSPTSKNAKYYANIVNEKSILRKSVELIYKTSNSQLTAEQQLDEIEKNTKQLRKKIHADDSTLNFSQMREGMFESLERMSDPDQGIYGVPTGIDKLDKFTNGLQEGNMYVLAARPGVGKTALATQIFLNASFSGKNCLFFSLEMSLEQMRNRMLFSVAEVDYRKFKSRSFTDIEWDGVWNRLSKGVEILDKYSDNINVNINSNININQIFSIANARNENKKIDFLVIDYLQLINGGSQYRSRAEEIASISRKIKVLSKEVNCPILALAQVSRAVEKENRDLMLSDLKESGAIEQDADMVMFITRDDIIDKNSLNAGYAKLQIAKGRNEGTGACILKYRGEYTKFYNDNTGHTWQYEKKKKGW